MLHANNPIIKHKVGLLNLAEELGSVSKTCKVMGVSRDMFYRYQELVEDGDIDSLINSSKRGANTKDRVDSAIERSIIEYAVAFPTHGQHRTSNELRKQGVYISGSGVRSIWLRNDLENFKKRLKALEAKVANDGIILSDAQGALYNAKDAIAFEGKRKILAEKFARLEQQKSAHGFFSSDQFRLVDAVYGTIFRYFSVFEDFVELEVFSHTPKVNQWRARVQNRLSVIRAVADNYSELLKKFLVNHNSYMSTLVFSTD